MSLGFFYFDSTLIIIIPAMIFSLVAQRMVKSRFDKYSRIPNQRHLTGAAAAQDFLYRAGIHDVAVKPIQGNLTDHYDPKTKTIGLSESVYNSASVAAVGIACHEAGHAVQHAHSYFPLKIRNAIIPLTRIGSSLGLPLAFIGIIFAFEPLIGIGLILYALVALFQLITLPVEFNASRRAVRVIDETGMLSQEENKGVKQVLTAAALTYVAALVSSLATILRLLLLSRGRRR